MCKIGNLIVMPYKDGAGVRFCVIDPNREKSTTLKSDLHTIDEAAVWIKKNNIDNENVVAGTSSCPLVIAMRQGDIINATRI